MHGALDRSLGLGQAVVSHHKNAIVAARLALAVAGSSPTAIGDDGFQLAAGQLRPQRSGFQDAYAAKGSNRA